MKFSDVLTEARRQAGDVIRVDLLAIWTAWAAQAVAKAGFHYNIELPSGLVQALFDSFAAAEAINVIGGIVDAGKKGIVDKFDTIFNTAWSAAAGIAAGCVGAAGAGVTWPPVTAVAVNAPLVFGPAIANDTRVALKSGANHIAQAGWVFQGAGPIAFTSNNPVAQAIGFITAAIGSAPEAGRVLYKEWGSRAALAVAGFFRERAMRLNPMQDAKAEQGVRETDALVPKGEEPPKGSAVTAINAF